MKTFPDNEPNPRPLRVVHLSTTDRAGGAALAAHRLHRALVAQGVDSSMFVARASDVDPRVRPFNASFVGPRWLGSALFRAGRRLQGRVATAGGALFTPDRTGFGRLPLWQLPAADIYNLHWVSDLVDYRMLPPITRRAPVVWTLHDMNPFTGGCHYDRGCGRFARACGACPVLGSDVPGDRSHRVLQRKRDLFHQLPPQALTVVTPSQWLAREARRSVALGRFENRVIPYGIDTDFFCPGVRPVARARLGIAAGDRVVLFVAEKLTDTRKGLVGLASILAQLAHLPQLRILTVGQGMEQTLTGPLYRHLGQLRDPAAVRDAYAAADVFVMPSLQDNFPNTVLESLACGTPIVGFAVGGVVDAVEGGVCGLLAAEGDHAQLLAQLVRLLSDDPWRESMREAARARAVALYTSGRQAQEYLALYQRLLAARARLPAAVLHPQTTI